MTLSEVWPWIVMVIVIMVYFTWFEARAFNHPESSWTLSRTVSYVGSKWPLSMVLWGMLIGGLSVHFFWPWSTNPLGPGGG